MTTEAPRARTPWTDADGCVYVLSTYVLCGRDSTREAGWNYLGVPLCPKHYFDVLSRARIASSDAEATEERWWAKRRRFNDRLDRVRTTFRESGRGWTFSVYVPQPEGRSKHRRQSGFATRAEAEQAVEKLIEAQRQPDDREQRIEKRRRTDDKAWRQRERRKERERLVYYVQRADGAIKIGTTWNIESRVQTFRNVSPCELLVVHTGGQPAEAALHRRFKADRLHGEWFAASSELLAHIEHVARVTAKRRGERTGR